MVRQVLDREAHRMRSFTLKPVRLSKAEQKRASKAAYQACVDRADGKCEGCGEAPAEHIHHRKYRSRGGTNELSNLVHLCADHHRLAHTAIGEQLGWSVLTNNDPAIIPVFHRGTGLWTQNDEPINAWDAMETMTLYGQVKGGG